MRALIDADIVAYTAAFTSCTWVTEHEAWYDMDEAKKTVEEIVTDWTEQAQADSAVCVLSPDDRTNYRSLIWPEYKTHRKATRKPPHLAEIQSHIREAYDVLSVPYLEADDVMGIVATRNPEDNVIVSTDKDMATIPALVYNPNRDYKNGPRLISDAEADRWLLTQTLIGDTTDGYKGALKVGPVRAKTLLSNHFRVREQGGTFVLEGCAEAAWDEVLAVFHKTGQGYEEAIQNLSMARILRDNWYKKEGDNRAVMLPTLKWHEGHWFDLP